MRFFFKFLNSDRCTYLIFSFQGGWETLKVRVSGDPVYLKCDTVCEPKMPVQWWYRNKPILQQDRKYIFTEDFGMVILNTTKADEGSYMCVSDGKYWLAAYEVRLPGRSHSHIQTFFFNICLQDTKEIQKTTCPDNICWKKVFSLFSDLCNHLSSIELRYMYVSLTLYIEIWTVVFSKHNHVVHSVSSHSFYIV